MDRLELRGTWNLKRLSDGSSRPMAVPGDILSALLESGEADDPYYDRNELALQWVGREDWLLERSIDIDEAFAASPSVILDLESIDTIAEVRINGALAGSSENMFTRFQAEVAPLVKAGRNEISVLIASPEKAAAQVGAALPYPIPMNHFPVTSPHRNLVRKAQCMAGWDWGPCLMTGGLYDGASLQAIAGPRMVYATTRTRRSGESWLATLEVELDSPAAGRIDLEATLAGARKRQGFDLPKGASTVTMELEPQGIEPWWPAGYGAQRLYELELRCVQTGQAISKRLGFRELEVVAEADELGRSMTFRVNGRDVFCKGANWIPADSLPSRWTRERYDLLLSAAADANMNCLRVWGGGRYESDDFYELCDEKGLLVWQDFMFACALYPSDPAFLASVEAEARHQVRRLKDHPCLALWCGNNENLGALGWYPESKKNPMRYVVDYDRLYEGTVGRVVRELDPDRTWWPTSPCGGPSDFSDNWHGDGRGDMHFWSVWHEGKSFSEYLTVRPRFCSEFGFQSFPNYATVASYAPEGERNVTSPTMEHHQRHDRGNTLIMETMARYFRMPAGQRETLYLSQVQQAMAIRTAVDYWRSLRPVCMGAIYWQLNDVWPVSSWSSLDYDGSWKLLHYEARRFFERLHLALILKDAVASVTVVNDGLEAYMGKLVLRLRLLDGTVAAEFACDAAIAAESSTELFKITVADLPRSPEESFLDAALELRGTTGVRERLRAQAFLAEPKRCSLPDPALSAIVMEGAAGTELVLKAGKPAFFVAPEADGIPGRFEDSGFHLMPGEERRLHFIPARGRPAPNASSLNAALRVMHLRASYE